MRLGITAALLIGVFSYLPGAVADEADPGPPAAGTMRFSKTRDAFVETKEAVFGPTDHVYALVGFGQPWHEQMRKANKGTSAVVKVHVGDEQKGSAAFYPGEAAFRQDTYVLEVLPEPAKASQFTFGVVRALAALPPGKHQVAIELWSFEATTKDRVLGKGTFTFVATEDGKKHLTDLVAALKEAKAKYRAAPARPPSQGAQKRVTVRRGGSELLYFRGDEIVLNGAVVGKFEGNRVRKGGSLVGEIRGTLFRHEGSDKWKLDKGNLYPGREIRWEGAIIGDVRKDGRIWWEGSDWGSVKPYGGTDAETMRLFAALYYFSDFFQRK